METLAAFSFWASVVAVAGLQREIVVVWGKMVSRVVSIVLLVVPIVLVNVVRPHAEDGYPLDYCAAERLAYQKYADLLSADDEGDYLATYERRHCAQLFARETRDRSDVEQYLTDKARCDQVHAWAADHHAYTVNVVQPRADEAFQQLKACRARQSDMEKRDEQGRALLTQIQTVTMAHPETAIVETRPLLERLAQVDPSKVDAAERFVQAYVSGTGNVPPAEPQHHD